MYKDMETWKNMYPKLLRCYYFWEVVVLGKFFTLALYVFRYFSNIYIYIFFQFSYCGKIQDTCNIKCMYINFKQKMAKDNS